MSCEAEVSMALTRAMARCREGREMTALETEELVASLADPKLEDRAKADFLTLGRAKGRRRGNWRG
ncbi:MAG: hypothetical protein EBV83_10335, partial [Verrucomicrobia bacterium]|nr:hypothetical protein [Verrucomicrobiota bacterium]